MAGISDLKSAIDKHGGLTRLCKYRLDASSLKINAFTSDVIRNLDFFLEGITVPGKALSTVKYSIWDKPLTLPTGIEDDELSLDFMMPNDHYIRSIFYNWINTIINNNTNRIGYLDDYSTDLIVYILNEQNEECYEIKCTRAYPISYSSTAFSATSSEYAKLSVKFAYHKVIERTLNKYPDKLNNNYKLNPGTGTIEIVNPPGVLDQFVKTQQLLGNIQERSSSGTFETISTISGVVPGSNIQDGAADSITNPSLLENGISNPLLPPAPVNNDASDIFANVEADPAAKKELTLNYKDSVS